MSEKGRRAWLSRIGMVVGVLLVFVGAAFLIACVGLALFFFVLTPKREVCGLEVGLLLLLGVLGLCTLAAGLDTLRRSRVIRRDTGPRPGHYRAGTARRGVIQICFGIGFLLVLVLYTLPLSVDQFLMLRTPATRLAIRLNGLGLTLCVLSIAFGIVKLVRAMRLPRR